MSKKKQKTITYYNAPKDTIRIGIDVDGVLALYKAYDWVFDIFPDDKTRKEFFKDIVEYHDFETRFEDFGIDNALDYWKKTDLYDKDVLEYPSAVLIDMLTKRYAPFLNIEWIIVSDCFVEHEQSKLKFLQRVFPFSFKFFNRKIKSEIPCDVYIDDKISNLRECYETHEAYTILVQHTYNRISKSLDDYHPDEIFEVFEHERILKSIMKKNTIKEIFNGKDC